jgi:hypothetical protein
MRGHLVQFDLFSHAHVRVTFASAAAAAAVAVVSAGTTQRFLQSLLPYRRLLQSFASFRRTAPVARRRRRATMAETLTRAVTVFNAVRWSQVFKICFFLLFLGYPGVSIKVLKVRGRRSWVLFGGIGGGGGEIARTTRCLA